MAHWYNAAMSKYPTRKLTSYAFISFFFILAGCASPSSSEGETSSASIAITPYQTSTISLQQSEPNDTPQPNELPAISPTPLTYIIVENDTLLGIAQRYSVSLDALLAANPGVNPNILTLGMELFIPQGQDGEVATLGLLTPQPLDLGESNCYATAANELWCFLLVENQQADAIDNLAGSITLVSSSGEELESGEATAPLNLLLPGQAMPLVAYWAVAPEGWAAAIGHLTSAYKVSDFEARYINAVPSNVRVDIAPNGHSARVNADLALGDASLVWLLAIAYDANDNVLGIRRWEGTGGDSEAELWVYSLGEVLFRVDLLIEARP
jgi:LysM repeat protein